MANVTLDETGKVTGCFAKAQPQLDGFAVIDDNDPRLAVFLGIDPISLANSAVHSQIAAIEATQTARRVREGQTSAAGLAWMQQTEAQISALRAQLQR